MKKSKVKSKQDILLEAQKVQKTIEEALDGVKSGTSTKDKIVAAYLSLAMQHYSSILVLIENDLPSSSAALMRPLVEALYRGTWFALIAKDKQAEDFNIGTLKLKQTYKLAKDIDREIENETFHHIYERNSSLLHGFTHGGMEQIGRQFNEDGETIIIEASFSDEELVEQLIASSTNVSMMLLAFSYNIKNSELADLAKGLIYQDT